MAQPMTALQPRVGCVCPSTSPHRSSSHAVRPSQHRLRFFGGLLPVAAAARLGFTKARVQRGCRAHRQQNDPWNPWAVFQEGCSLQWYGGFTGKQLPARKVGDVVTGRVKKNCKMLNSQRGLWREIVLKGFPKQNVVLKIENLSEETELKPGSVIKGKVVEVLEPSEIRRLEILERLSKISKRRISDGSSKPQSPWDKLWACFLTGRRVKVTLQKWMNFGWRVATEEGLVGFIREYRFYGPVYGRFFNNPDLKGKELKCKICKMKENYREPVRYRDYSIEFFDLGSEASLAQKYRVGCIYAATVQSFNGSVMDILIDGVRFRLRKIDITSCKEPGFGSVELSDVFRIGEVIKVLCVAVRQDEVHWSIRALEPKPGALLKNKVKVFEEAEANARLFRQRRAEELRKMDRLMMDSQALIKEMMADMETKDSENLAKRDQTSSRFALPWFKVPRSDMCWANSSLVVAILHLHDVHDTYSGNADLASHGLLQFNGPFWDCEKLERLSTAAYQHTRWCTLRGCL